jgi:hypothetical protein
MASSPASVIAPSTNLPFWHSPTASHCLLRFHLTFTRNLILTLLLISGIHPNPGPPSSSLAPLPVLQLNINGLRNSVADLNSFLRDERISISALQETFLSDASVSPGFPGYTLVKKDRARGRGGGLAFLVYQSVSYTPVDTSFVMGSHIECQAISFLE